MIEQVLLERMAAPAGDAVGVQFDGGQHAVTADVGDDRNILEREHRVEEVGRKRTAALEQVFVW